MFPLLSNLKSRQFLLPPPLGLQEALPAGIPGNTIYSVALADLHLERLLIKGETKKGLSPKIHSIGLFREAFCLSPRSALVQLWPCGQGWASLLLGGNGSIDGSQLKLLQILPRGTSVNRYSPNPNTLHPIQLKGLEILQGPTDF